MRVVEWSTQIGRDYRRELKSQRGKRLATEFAALLELLVTDAPLEAKYRDHPLKGDWKGYRDCHVWPDLVLIYSKPDAKTLRLVRLGSHSELFG